MPFRSRRRLALPQGLPEALPVWLVTRFGVLVIGYVAVMAIGFPTRVPWVVSDVPLLNLPARWDAGWYLPIAERGYTWPPSAPGGQSDVAFFPLYPLLIRLGGWLLGGRPFLAAWLISMAACLWGLVYFHRLARRHMGADESAAALVLLAAYPFAVFYSAVYTESLFLLCLVAATFHASRADWIRAAAWGLLAGLARPTGFALSAVLALTAIAPAAVGRWPRLRPWLLGSVPARGAVLGEAGVSSTQAVPRVRAGLLIAALMPLAGVALYSGYVYTLTGSPFTWSTLQAAWRRSDAGLHAIVNTLRAIHSLGWEGWINKPIDALNELGALFLLFGVWPVLRRFGAGYALLMLLTILPALMSGGVMALGRYTAPIFPLFLWLGASVPARHRTLLVAVFAMLQAIVATLFFSWRPMM
jgi:hypothetical protein